MVAGAHVTLKEATQEAFVCDWQPDDLNPGPDCPYCAGEMCGRLDGIRCTHGRVERHGYDTQQPRTPSTLRLTGEQLASIEPPVSGEWFIDLDEYEDFVVAADLLVQIEKAVRDIPRDRGDDEWDTVAREDVIAVLRIAAIRSAAPVEPT